MLKKISREEAEEQQSTLGGYSSSKKGPNLCNKDVFFRIKAVELFFVWGIYTPHHFCSHQSLHSLEFLKFEGLKQTHHAWTVWRIKQSPFWSRSPRPKWWYDEDRMCCVKEWFRSKEGECKCFHSPYTSLEIPIRTVYIFGVCLNSYEGICPIYLWRKVSNLNYYMMLIQQW